MYNRRGLSYPKKHVNGKYYQSTPQDVYECGTHKLLPKRPGPICSSHHIRTEAVKEIILDVLQKTSGFVREHEAEFVELVREQSAIRNGATAKIHQKQITKNQRRIAELDKLIISIYEDKVKGLLPEERFSQMAMIYDQEQATLKAQTAMLQNELDAFNADSVRVDKFVDLLRRYTQFDELTGNMIAEFVDKVIVHEGEWSEGVNANGRGLGTRTQEVEVYLKYIGKIDVPDPRTAEEIDAEYAAMEKLEKRRKRNRETSRRYYETKRRETKKTAAQKTA